VTLSTPLLCACLGACATLSFAHRQHFASPPYAVARYAGLRLSTQLPTGPYTRNELTRATLTAVNTSGRVVTLLDTCPYGALQVQVWTRDGRPVYPPVLPGEPSPRCGGAPSAEPLRPGQTVWRSVYVVLRGSVLSPLVSVVRAKGSSVAVLGGRRVLTLRRGSAPRVSFVSGAAGIVARVRFTGGRASGLLYRYWARCASSSQVTEVTSGTGYAWSSTTEPRIHLEYSSFSCPQSSRLEWHGLAGWIGQPVASIDYSRAP
jgi:hypothetical protein